jgi:hypothetical protein
MGWAGYQMTKEELLTALRTPANPWHGVVKLMDHLYWVDPGLYHDLCATLRGGPGGDWYGTRDHVDAMTIAYDRGEWDQTVAWMQAEAAGAVTRHGVPFVPRNSTIPDGLGI